VKTRRFHANHAPAALSKNEPRHDIATSKQGNALAGNKLFEKIFPIPAAFPPSITIPPQRTALMQQKTALDTEGRFSYISALL